MRTNKLHLFLFLLKFFFFLPEPFSSGESLYQHYQR